DEETGRERLERGPPHRLDRHRLAEGDRRGLDPAAADAANGCGSVALEGGAQFGDLVAPPALEAVRVGRVAVQLDDLLVGDAGGLMEPVDVLGDHRSGRAAADELGDLMIIRHAGSLANRSRRAKPGMRSWQSE